MVRQLSGLNCASGVSEPVRQLSGLNCASGVSEPVGPALDWKVDRAPVNGQAQVVGAALQNTKSFQAEPTTESGHGQENTNRFLQNQRRSRVAVGKVLRRCLLSGQ
jgi:hypothetical protein